ncbi:hypothetical protein OUHCRE19_31400 [Enterobacter asburiae]
MFRSLILAAVLLVSAPLIANAGEITLLCSAAKFFALKSKKNCTAEP